VSYEPIKSQDIRDAELASRTPSYSPRVSTDPRAHYTTQSTAYDRLLDNGPLTNRKISRYQKEGRLPSSGLLLPPLRKREKRNRLTKADVLKELDAYK
jgi:hypothetical protein